MNWSHLKGMTDRRRAALISAGCKDPVDLLDWAPLRYESPAVLMELDFIHPDSGKVTTFAQASYTAVEGIGNHKRFVVHFVHHGRILEAVWFRGLQWITKSIKPGLWYTITGTASVFRGKLQMTHPEVKEIKDPSHQTPTTSSQSTFYQPVYPSTTEMKAARITHTLIQAWVSQILESKTFEEYIPKDILQDLRLVDIRSAYRAIHLPKEYREWEPALERMRFAELFLFELAVMRLRGRNRSKVMGHVIREVGPMTRAFIDQLPFELTEGQRSALRQIYQDLRSGYQMNRLVQGDVGAGKTVVAVAAMLMMVDHGFQGAMMAPTEILAEQHYRNLEQWLTQIGRSCALITGSTSGKKREDILSKIKEGNIQVIIGTHALLEQDIDIPKLGIAVIDEQHRFGVLQRARLLAKREHPHVLVMSATPIPRSLALTLYGELDVSVVKGLPAGRQPVKTLVKSDSHREQVYQFMQEALSSGSQAYVVYPLVQESEHLDLKDATAGYEMLIERFPAFKVGLVHGKMKSADKDATMKLFKDGELDILVSTTVIEVGVDVPNASIMIIEHAERFGLSQLHQLRGRVGRGSTQSTCFLMADFKRSADARERLSTMERTNDGFEIAEADLKLRGPGDFLGTRQSGLPEFKYADLARDQQLLEKAKDLAERIITEDPELEQAEHQRLKIIFEPYLAERSNYLKMS
jgi:ATP-dependent DNA helicase RecG